MNPRIIYGAISGYGQTGPAAGRPAYAPVIHASTGYDMAHLFYQQGRERPDNCGIFVADYASGSYAMGAILAARSEEHTSELQSHLNLVCRLLLEKKKNNICR